MRLRSLGVFGLTLLLVPTLALADPDRQISVDDVLRLHYAGVSEEIIISEIIVTGSVFELSVDEILRLKRAGLSDRLIQYMIDTERIDPGEDYLVESELDEGAYDYSDEEWEGEAWVNVIEESPEPVTTYNVSLSYSYPSWWYDCYWYDYWYYDWAYYPYRSSWSISIGAWYPGWYTCATWVAPCAGWRYSCGVYPTHYGYYSGYYNYHHSGSGYRYPSQTKYKSNRGGTTYYNAPTKLRVPDSRQTVDRPRELALGSDHSSSRLYPSKIKTGGGGRPIDTPIKTVGSGRPGPKTPSVGIADDGRKPPRRKVTAVRTPATGGRPVKVSDRTTKGVSRPPTGSQVRPPRRITNKSSGKAPNSIRKPPTRQPTRSVTKSPPKRSTPKRGVTTSPPKTSRPKGVRPAPKRSAPSRSKASTPRRSAGTKTRGSRGR